MKNIIEKIIYSDAFIRLCIYAGALALCIKF